MTEHETLSADQLPKNWEDIAESMPEAVSDRNDISLCPKCFEPIQPHAHLCHKCGGPISAFALIDPLARIWGEGFTYRQLTRVGSSPSLAAVVGVWLIFVPGILTSLGYFLSFSKQLLDSVAFSRPAVASSYAEILVTFLSGALMTFVCAIQVAILRRVTINYRRARASQQVEE